MRAGDGTEWSGGAAWELGVKDLRGALQLLLWFASHLIPSLSRNVCSVHPCQARSGSLSFLPPLSPNCRLGSLS